MIINDDRAERLAQELAELTGESITDAVIAALEMRLAEVRRGPRSIGDKIRPLGELGTPRTLRTVLGVPS